VPTIRRALAAVLIAAVIFWWTYERLMLIPAVYAIDFTYPWHAANFLLAGDNPYARMTPGRYPTAGPFLYPLPAAIVAAPFAGLSAQMAGAVFNGLSAGVLAFALTRQAWWPLLMFLSPAYVLSYYNVQWPPLMVACALLPALSFLSVAKPNLGLVAFAYRPNRWAVIGGAVLLLVSFILVPRWPLDWWHALHQQTTQHTPAVLWPFGAVGLVGLLRWRKPEGRLLAAMTLAPTSAVPYDHLLLWLMPKTWVQSLILSAAAWAAWLLVLATAPHDLTKSATVAHAFVALGTYVPASVMVWLRKHDETPTA
jgi:hypothetical protein